MIVLSMIFSMVSIIFCIIAILSATQTLTLPIEKIGVPLFSNDVKWTLFIYKNLKKLILTEDDRTSKTYNVKNTDYYVVFYDSWLFEVYKSESVENLGDKYSLGGQSNKADYLTKWQKMIGNKIEQWYLRNNIITNNG